MDFFGSDVSFWVLCIQLINIVLSFIWSFWLWSREQKSTLVSPSDATESSFLLPDTDYTKNEGQDSEKFDKTKRSRRLLHLTGAVVTLEYGVCLLVFNELQARSA